MDNRFRVEKVLRGGEECYAIVQATDNGPVYAYYFYKEEDAQRHCHALNNPEQAYAPENDEEGTDGEEK